jgi:uncharacterized membrane protein
MANISNISFVTTLRDSYRLALGDLVARLFADPEGQLTKDLRQFKAYAEHQRSENREMGRSKGNGRHIPPY